MCVIFSGIYSNSNLKTTQVVQSAEQHRGKTQKKEKGNKIYSNGQEDSFLGCALVVFCGELQLEKKQGGENNKGQVSRHGCESGTPVIILSVQLQQTSSSSHQP